jgi:hypothetical protein
VLEPNLLTEDYRRRPSILRSLGEGKPHQRRGNIHWIILSYLAFGNRISPARHVCGAEHAGF